MQCNPPGWQGSTNTKTLFNGQIFIHSQLLYINEYKYDLSGHSCAHKYVTIYNYVHKAENCSMWHWWVYFLVFFRLVTTYFSDSTPSRSRRTGFEHVSFLDERSELLV